ncbi:MAG: Ig-like domain-containing protein [Cyclobacteriaceae bacterium]|nr:Ig-like domain-containing protein [Cyclobacteriaceae bacterium]
MKRLVYIAVLILTSCVGTDFVEVNYENIELLNPIQSLALGGNHLFETKYTSILGVEEQAIIYWESSNPSVATIDQNGLVNGVALGEVTITYSTNTIQRSITFEVAQTTIIDFQKTATLQGSGRYNASGTALLYKNDNDILILELSNDFDTDFALGTFVYLANSIDGQTVKSSGLDLGEITSGGAKSFNITNFNSAADLSTYKYIVILCKPAGITFGFGEFN